MGVNQFRDVVEIVKHKAGSTVDDYGEPINQTTETLSVFADVIEQTGREAVMSGALQALGTAVCRIRYDEQTKNVDESWYVVHRGYNWAIQSVMHFKAKDIVELFIKRGVAV